VNRESSQNCQKLEVKMKNCVNMLQKEDEEKEELLGKY